MSKEESARGKGKTHLCIVGDSSYSFRVDPKRKHVSLPIRILPISQSCPFSVDGYQHPIDADRGREDSKTDSEQTLIHGNSHSVPQTCNANFL